jgi:hypothetical protein
MAIDVKKITNELENVSTPYEKESLAIVRLFIRGHKAGLTGRQASPFG